MTLTPQFPRDESPAQATVWWLLLLVKSARALRERRARRLEVKRAKELELVVVDKRAKRKESRVLDSNGESGDLGGLCPGRGGRASVMNFNGKSTND